jgi:hypothetical protein
MSTRLRYVLGTRYWQDGRLGTLMCGIGKGQVSGYRQFVVLFECRVVWETETWGHTVFVGWVVAVKGHPDKHMHLFVTRNFT